MTMVMTLWDYAKENEPELVAQLLAEEGGQVPVDDMNDLGETALHIAASSGHDDVIQVLLQHQASLVAKDWESGWTPLHRSLYHQHLSTSLLLLRHAQLYYGKKFAKTYLYDTLDNGHQSPIDLLSRRSADVFHREAAFASEQASRSGMVYTFGKADFQLGYHLPHADVQSSPRLVELPITSPIVQISASKYHTIALNSAGQCFVWGFGKGGRLGTGTEFDHVEPTRILSLDQIPIKKVAAGENHTLALSRSGQIFSWGSNSFGQLGHNVKTCTYQSRLTPKRIDTFRGLVMVDVAASGCHSAAICGENGSVFTWGSNRKGQLGRKEGFGNDQPYPTPRCVDALLLHHPISAIYEDYDDMKAVSLALSDAHTSVILRCTTNGRSHGQVWQFGYGSHVPTRINFQDKRRTSSLLMSDLWTPTWKLKSTDIIQISCAQNHSIALTACGSVYTWGHNSPALSHHPSDKNKKPFALGAPQKVSLEKYGSVTSICASQDHCAVVTRNGDLVTWGCAPQGVLGHGQGNTWQPSPKRVAGVKKALAVATGHQHTAVLVAPFNPFNNYMESSAVPSLQALLQRQIMRYMDISNCATVWKYAELMNAKSLHDHCLEYMRMNWDAVLDITGRERMETLFELFLPPQPEVMLELKQHAHMIIPLQANPVTMSPMLHSLKTPSVGRPGKRIVKRDGPESEVSLPVVNTSKNLPDEAPAPSDNAVAAVIGEQARQQSVSVKSGSRRKTGKFVSLDTFLSNRSTESTTRCTKSPAMVTSVLSPWSIPAASPKEEGQSIEELEVFSLDKSKPSSRKGSTDEVAPSITAMRKASIGSGYAASPRIYPNASPVLESGKQVLGQDGLEHRQVSTFSLDAFIRKPSQKGRKKSNAEELEQSKPTTWTVVPESQRAPTKTLQEIQAEEQARAAAEAEAKARLGGFTRRPSSTINSWGLCETPGHVSLAEVQKLQEEQEFLAQQRAILEEIERERSNKGRKIKVAAAATTNEAGGDVKQSKAKAKKKKNKSLAKDDAIQGNTASLSHKARKKKASETTNTAKSPEELKEVGGAAKKMKKKKEKAPRNTTAAAASSTGSANPSSNGVVEETARNRSKDGRKQSTRTTISATDRHEKKKPTRETSRASFNVNAAPFQPQEPSESVFTIDIEALEPWQSEWQNDMALLSCTKRQRALLWHRHQRALVHRKSLSKKRTTAATTSASPGASTSTTTLIPAFVANQPLSPPPPPPLTTHPSMMTSVRHVNTMTKPMSLPAAALATEPTKSAELPVEKDQQSKPETEDTSGNDNKDSKSTDSQEPLSWTSPSSWRTMFLTFFAMIQPEWSKERMEIENDFLDDLRISSVPPAISDVVVSKDRELFWRYDMDSYAANRHNEDRSQYVLDALEERQTGVKSSVFFCACYDGHGGEEAVEFVQGHLYENIKQHLITGKETVAHAILSGFKDTDEEFNRQSQLQFQRGHWSACSVGACAVIALVVGKRLYVASCGDCRAVMAFRESDGTLSVEQITFDHSANDEREQRRLRVLYPEDYDIVREIGNKNFYVKGRLQPTRSIGDTYMKVKEVNRAPMPRGLRIHGSFKRPYITAVPDVFEVDLTDRQPEFLVLGSDGLYGEMENQEIIQMVAKFREQGVENVSLAMRSAVLGRIANLYGLSTKDMENILPGERRNYHDDITIDVLHFSPPLSCKIEAPAA